MARGSTSVSHEAWRARVCSKLAQGPGRVRAPGETPRPSIPPTRTWLVLLLVRLSLLTKLAKSSRVAKLKRLRQKGTTAAGPGRGSGVTGAPRSY
jgi:hypothetical protein